MRKLLAVWLLLFSLTAAAQMNAGNIAFTVLPSAARTAASVNSIDYTNNTFRAVQVVVNVSAFTSGTYTATIQGKDPVSGNYYTLLTGTAIGATGTFLLTVAPGVTAAANSAASMVLPRTWRVSMAGATSPSMTFSVGAHLLQ